MTVKALDKRLLLILLLQLAAALVFVFYRTVDADEGFYLAAAQRVADGMMPYVDFFFPQAPLMPLTFFAFSGWGIESLLLLRVLATLAGLATTYVMYQLVKRTMRSSTVAATASFLMAFGGLFLTWHSTFKPYAFVDLALLISFSFLLRSGEDESIDSKAIFFAWLALGFAINFRSIFVVLIPIYVYALVLAARRARSAIAKPAGIAALGILLPSLPAIYLLISSPEQFYFNNLGFHLQREPIDSVAKLVLHKLTVLGKFFALPQTILLVGAAIASYFLMRSRYVQKTIIYKSAGLFALVITAVYLVPTPMHLQYFQQATPYLIMMSLPTAAYVLQHAQLKRILRSAAVLYLVGIAPFVYLFILAPRAEDQRFEWPQLRSIVASIQSNSNSQDTLLSEWAGYSALSARPQIAGSEHIGFHFPLDLTEAEYRENHLLTNTEIAAALSAQRPHLVVIDYKVYPEWENALNANYRLIDQSDQTFIYKRANEAL